MTKDELYVLVKHGRFSAEYINKSPVWERRFMLNKLFEEADEMNKQREAEMNRARR